AKRLDEGRELLTAQLKTANYPLREIEVVERDPESVEIVATLVGTSANRDELERVVSALRRAAITQHATWAVRTVEGGFAAHGNQSANPNCLCRSSVALAKISLTSSSTTRFSPRISASQSGSPAFVRKTRMLKSSTIAPRFSCSAVRSMPSSSFGVF